jgi:hypothetical protein
MLSCPAPRSPTNPTTSPAWIYGHPRQHQPRDAFTVRRPAKDLRGFAPDDEQDHLFRCGRIDAPLTGNAAVAQHHHAVGDFENLVQPM